MADENEAVVEEQVPVADDATPVQDPAPVAAPELNEDGTEKELAAAEPTPAKTPWYTSRIAQLTAQAKAAEEAKLAAEVEAATAKALARGEKPAAPTEADVDTLATKKATEIASQAAFDNACNSAVAAGAEEFKDFSTVIGNFKNLGGLPKELVEVALETDHPHRVLYTLGKDLDEAARILALSPTKMAMAIAKLKVEAPVVKPVSAAPAPISPLNKGKPAVSKNPDDMSVAEWMEWRNSQLKAKAG